MRNLLVLTMVLAMSSIALGQFEMNWEIPQGTATVDGDLSDWAGAQWDLLAGQPLLFGPAADPWANADWFNGYYSARWVPGGLYVAIKVEEGDLQLSVSGYPGLWGSDYARILVDPANENLGEIRYNGLAGGAIWSIGKDQTSADWLAVYEGNTAAPGLGELYATSVTNVSGGWNMLHYEAFIPANNGSAIAYSSGDVIGLDVGMVTQYGPSADEWAYIYGAGWPEGHVSYYWTDYTLVPEPFTMSLLGIGGLALLRRKK